MIELDGHNLSIEDVWRASQGEPCVIKEEAKGPMQKSRDFVERLCDEPRAIYGINTGFGPLSGFRASKEDLAQHQLNLLHHLSVGQGEPFSPAETRAIMVARANALARGFSGIRVEVVELLLACLNRNILPVIPSQGSVGASGDLVPLAHMARMLAGIGPVTINGRPAEAAQALKEAGLQPVVLRAKEGLALVNGTSAMTGLACLAVQESAAILSWMELLSANLIQAMYGAPEVLCQQLHRARGHRGQYLVASRMTAHLRSHPRYAQLIDDHNWGTQEKALEEGVEIQDPYSLRCSPQILGAFQDVFWHVEQMVSRELNATTDNPLVFADTETVIHGGNFYGQHVSFAMDYLRLGLIKSALLSERQIDRLLNWRYSQGLPPLLTGGNPGLNSGMAGCQLLATSLAAELRILSMPASVQTIPTNGNNQDVVSMGTHAARMSRQALPMVWRILAIETLALCQAADLRKRGDVMGGDYQTLHKAIRALSPMLCEDRPLKEDIERVAAYLASEEGQAAHLLARPKNPIGINLDQES
jgi:phenylalanine ammonia-lyase